MPYYDRICQACGFKQIDCLEPISSPDPLCPSCGAELKRGFIGKSNAVRDDSIPGGLEIKHGLCWPDGTPRRFDSYTDIARAAKEKGFINSVTHVPTRESDKNKHTVRWVAPPTISEEDRIRHWHEHEHYLAQQVGEAHE